MVGSGGGLPGLDLACNGPGEGCHLAGYGGGDHVDILAGSHEPPEAGAEPDLSLPGDRPYRFRHIVEPDLDPIPRHGAA